MKNTELSNYSYTKIENDPRTALSKGTIITDMSSKSLKTDELIKDSYEIIDLIGSGGSALVYKAYKMSQTSIEKEFCLLKEIYPKNYDFDIIRYPKMKNGLKCEYLKIDELISVYIEATKEEIRIHNEASTNDEGCRSTYFFKKSSIFTADNNLTYVVLDTVQGETLQYLLENNKVKSLSEICGYMISAVNALEYLHGKNVLHLDLSPDNFFVCATTTKEEYDLKIIDYNSARKYVEGKGVSVLHGLSSKQEFEAPEVSIYKPDIYADSVPIDHRADLFSVAAIFYYILFNDSVPRTENTYANEGKIKCKESTYFNTVPFTAQKLTREFLLKGLSIQPWNRYENCEEMREALLLIKKEAEEPIWLLPSAHMEEPQYCVRRDRQIEEIDKILEDKNHIFISGIGGSGKTTLATLYALAKKEKYSTIKMVTYSPVLDENDNNHKEFKEYQGLKGLIARLEFAGIDDNKYISSSEYDIDSMYRAKMDALSKYTDKNTLLIVDNINSMNDDDNACLSKILEMCQCKLIFTTRINREGYYYPDNCEEELIDLLRNILKDKPDKRDDQKGLKEIVKLTNKHFLLTKMIGMLLANSPNSINNVIEHLESGNRFNEDEIDIDNNENGGLLQINTTIENYLLKTFDLSQIGDLSQNKDSSARREEKRFILSAMTIVPYSGMDKDNFACALKLKNYNSLNELIKLGWISIANNVISLHPVISDLFFRNISESNNSSIKSLLKSKQYSELFGVNNVSMSSEKLIDNYMFIIGKRRDYCCYLKKWYKHCINEIINKVDDEHPNKDWYIKLFFLHGLKMLYYFNSASANWEGMYGTLISMSYIFDRDAALKLLSGFKTSVIIWLLLSIVLAILSCNSYYFLGKANPVFAGCLLLFIMNSLGFLHKGCIYIKTLSQIKRIDNLLSSYQSPSSDYDAISDDFKDIVSFYTNDIPNNKSEEYYNRVITAHKRAGVENNGIAIAYNERGMYYYSMHKYTEAEKDLIESIRILESINLKENAISLSIIHFNLASIYKEIHRPNEAATHYSKALDMQKGYNVRKILITYNNLICLYINEKEYQKAESLLEEYERELFEWHEKSIELINTLAIGFNGLACKYWKLSNRSKAVYFFTKAFEVAEKNLGLNHETTKVICNNMYKYYKSVGNNKTAQKFKKMISKE